MGAITAIRIKYADPRLNGADAEAASNAILEGHIADGYYVRRFEEECAKRWGGYWVACSSGTAALRLCRQAGAYVAQTFIPDFTFQATYEALGNTIRVTTHWDGEEWQARPDDMVYDPDSRRIAFCRVQLGGIPMRTVGIIDFSDDCQSFGFLPPSCPRTAYSFSPSKSITCGHGGAARFESKIEAECAARFRNHGKFGAEYDHVEGGFNYMLDDPRAAVLLSQMKRLDAIVETRVATAERFRSRIGKSGPMGPTLRMPIFQSGEKRDTCRSILTADGVETRLPYPSPLSGFRDVGLFLPTQALPPEDVDSICRVVENFL